MSFQNVFAFSFGLLPLYQHFLDVQLVLLTGIRDRFNIVEHFNLIGLFAHKVALGFSAEQFLTKESI